MTVDLFADYYQWTVTSGGTTAPSAGTSESWTVSSSTGVPAASNAATPTTQFRVVDAADANRPPEVMAITNVSGTTWTVTRGVEGAAPWAHSASFTAVPVLTAGAMAQFPQFGAYVPTDPAHTQIGAPTTGTHAAGEVFVDANGAIWACSIAGTPGTWFAAGSGVELGSADLSSDPIAATTTVADIAGLSITFTAPARAFIVELLIPLSSLTAAADDLLVTITDSANVVLAQALMVGGNSSFPLNCPPAYINVRLPRVAGGVTAYAITPGQSYTFKARQRAGAGTAQINTAGGQFRPLLRAVTC